MLLDIDIELPKIRFEGSSKKQRQKVRKFATKFCSVLKITPLPIVTVLTNVSYDGGVFQIYYNFT